MPPLEEAAKSAYYGNSRLMRGLPGRSGRQSRTSFNSVDYWAWQNATSTRPYQVDRMEPLGKVMVEFTYAAILGVCIGLRIGCSSGHIRHAVRGGRSWGCARLDGA